MIARSSLFQFNKIPAYIELEQDVLNRPAFRIFTWHGESQPNEEYSESGGWWHFASGIVESNGNLNLFDEVTAFGYELATSLELDDEAKETLWDSGPNDQARLIVQIMIDGSHQCSALEAPESIEGYASDEFQKAFAGP